jgi:hypothetical protein
MMDIDKDEVREEIAADSMGVRNPRRVLRV